MTDNDYRRRNLRKARQVWEALPPAQRQRRPVYTNREPEPDPPPCPPQNERTE